MDWWLIFSGITLSFHSGFLSPPVFHVYEDSVHLESGGRYAQQVQPGVRVEHVVEPTCGGSNTFSVLTKFYG